MNCKKVKKILTAYISDELSKDERWEVEMHLQICPCCQREFVSLQATREMLGVWDEVDPPEELSKRFETRLAEEALKGESFTFHVSRFTFHSTKWLYASATAVCFLTAVTLGLYILLSPEKGASPPAPLHKFLERGEDTQSPVTSHQSLSDIWVSFYISEHEKTLKHATLQKAALPRETPIHIPLRRENILYYDELSGEREKLKGQSGLILKSESEWKEETKDESHGEVLSGEALTLEEAKKSVSFNIIAPSVIRGEYQLTMVRKAKDKECVQLVYSNGLGVISLFEQPLEASAKFDRRDFREYILRLAKNEGPIAVLGWGTEQLAFNLTGEMPLSELMKIAEEIQERRLTDEARSYYQMLYGGE